MATKSKDIRARILKQRGVELEKHTRKLVRFADLPAPYRKSPLMRLVEEQQNEKLENLLWEGTIYEVGKKLGIDYSTVSKWKKLITAMKDEEFFKQFKEERR